ncbi:PhzF family phenazine biosynthesis isomerase [Brevibacterium sp. 5221]|uniref:PhzF family phenazine biosynthesis isomerase n=1 Tax=Brevibacterium rongguiense TaxID=2695267 RepID=A0A6N9H611_9MICO|nr:PhzF family phenazine biosynthesis protein [Brevibacterium rongguiense]MYM19379.1 PhzF family phenazine biosynthesis isomerase [Brevibacterium rongguiense]
MSAHPFSQVDVFASGPISGNPVAVVHAAQDVPDDRMASFARWTNLSETTFLLPPAHPEADYRLRIFTPGAEIPFAGHPTLGSAHAWLAAGGEPREPGRLRQECGLGLIDLRIGADATIAFAAPEFVRTGEPELIDLHGALAALGIGEERLFAANWIDNGPGWLGLHLDSAQTVLGLEPDFAALGDLKVGVLGAHPAGGPADVEVRAFCPAYGVPEDPVTGSLNAGFARWLIPAGDLPEDYTAAQGTALARAGRVSVTSADGEIWVGGATASTITGTVEL